MGNFNRLNMGLEQVYEAPIVGPLDYADATAGVIQLTASQQRVLVKTSNAGAYTVKMPPVSECAGKLFTIHMTAHDTNAVTVTDYGDTIGTAPNTLQGSLAAALNAADDWIVLFCNGLNWYNLASNSVTIS